MEACLKSITIQDKTYRYCDIHTLETFGYNIKSLPFSIRVLLESSLRQFDGDKITEAHVEALANWSAHQGTSEVAFMPSRILLQDFTGVPAVVDLAAMRDAVAKAGLNPETINPVIPVDLVIDHSVMVDAYGSKDALAFNMKKEFERNGERYRFLKWAGKAFDNFRVIPPGTGIIHQVNLEYLATVVTDKSDTNKEHWLFPDTLVGTDSHTTMVNGLSVLGWGVGGIEAEAAMLGQPIYLTAPEVIGVELTGRLEEGATATDMALTVTEMLRKENVVGKFVEYFGQGVTTMSLADRATVANMSPEYGATMGYFPTDFETMAYLAQTGREEGVISRAELYLKAAGLFQDNQQTPPTYTKVLQLDLSSIVPSLAGPKRPQDRVPMASMKKSFDDVCKKPVTEGGFGLSDASINTKSLIDWSDTKESLETGSVVLAAITSCTNTSNPSVMLGAGLVAQKAVSFGLKIPRYVKTSLTPGSQVVTDYLKNAGLLEHLETLGFHVAGYGCATCIGNSGPLPEPVAQAIDRDNLTVASVLSGNRNFEGRIHAKIKANYLASPMLVVAYALAGKVTLDLTSEPIGYSKDGQAVFLKDIWPTSKEISQAMAMAIKPEDFRHRYSHALDNNAIFNNIEVAESSLYPWDVASTYIQHPTFFDRIGEEVPPISNINSARVLAYLGDSVTTDHISPAGAIGLNTPAGKYLTEKGIEAYQFNSYGSRRGNHEVMMRGTFANIRIRNRLLDNIEGGMTSYLPDGKEMAIFDAAMAYQKQGQPQVILAGKEYGTGSSRDWAAKGTWLLGVKAVIAESYERIHRSNLVGMGVMPLQFMAGDNTKQLGLTGKELITIEGLSDNIEANQVVQVKALASDGKETNFKAKLRLDSITEIHYYRQGGILHSLLKDMISS